MGLNNHTLAEKPWDMVGRPSSSCASVWSTLLEGCCAKKSLSEPLGSPAARQSSAPWHSSCQATDLSKLTTSITDAAS